MTKNTRKIVTRLPQTSPHSPRISKALFAVIIGLSMMLGVAYVADVNAGSAPTRTARSQERWVDANHVRVNVNGDWVDLELEPLADHLCASRHPLFRRYCIDQAK